MKVARREQDLVSRTVSRDDHFRVLQHNVVRPEGEEKVTGRARYADDLKTENALYGKTIRATVAHGRLRDIRFLPGVPWDEFTVVTAKDVPGQNAVTLMTLDQPFLCAEEILHKAEPIALIAHPDKGLVEKAAKLVELDVEPLPAVYTIEEAETHPEAFGGANPMQQYRIGAEAIPQSVWDGCDLVLEETYRTGAAEQLYIEPNAMIAQVEVDADGRAKKVSVWGSLQCPFYVQKALAPLFGLPPGRVRVVQAETGGGFGGKEEYPNLIAGHAALLSWKAGGRPVRLVYDRQEDLWATTKRHPSRTTVKAGFSRDGTLRALDVDLHLNAGAYRTLSTVVLSRAVLHALGAYRCPHARARGRAWLTHSNPFGAFRGFGAPQALFALELHLSRCAHALGLDPAALRRKNLYRAGDAMPFGQVIEERIELDRMLDRALERSDYAAKKAAFEAFNETQRATGGTRRRGLGVAFSLHGCGFTGEGETRMAPRLTLELQPDGRVDILAGSVEYGQGTVTTLAQIAAEALGVPVDWVRKRQPETDAVPDSADLKPGHTPEAFAAAARAAHGRRGAPLRVTVDYQRPAPADWDEAHYRGTPYAAYAWKCDVVAVELDLVDYATRCTAFHSVVEAGRVLNPLLAAGQIEGGNAQALGFALYEHTVMEEGAMANCQYTNYIIPTTADTPDIDVEFVEFPYANPGAYSAKGLGELPIDGPAPALAAAVAHALGGVFVNELPILPERVMDALEAAGAVG